MKSSTVDKTTSRLLTRVDTGQPDLCSNPVSFACPELTTNRCEGLVSSILFVPAILDSMSKPVDQSRFLFGQKRLIAHLVEPLLLLGAPRQISSKQSIGRFPHGALVIGIRVAMGGRIDLFDPLLRQ